MLEIPTGRGALMASEEQQTAHDLATIERREGYLWTTALLLLLVFVVATLLVAHVIVVGGPEAGAQRPSLIPALVALSMLILAFCAYVLYARRSFSKVRRLFEARAVRDALTGLLNRQSFPERVRREMAKSDREGTLLGVLVCDLDDFKRVNDTYGHPAGDMALHKVAEAVLSATRGSDLSFRWGGDEVLVLLSPTEREGALAAANRIRSHLHAAEVELGFALDLSIGIAFYPEHGSEIEDLIRLADRALYIAKKSGDRIHIGEEELPLDGASVKLVFQPVVDSNSRETLGWEVLSRDPSEGGGVEMLFRRYAAVGQLDELKRMIFKRQLEEAERLNLPRLFVNVDFSMLESLGPVARPPTVDVVLEITESETVGGSSAHNLELVEQWRANGFKFAIDDFGSGFISLPFVAELFPDFIKMDRKAMLEAGDSPRFGAFMRDLVAAMRNYSQEGIIAEGIETEAEMAVVRKLGVDQVQGHLTGRPEEMLSPRADEGVGTPS
jgi:diguanylate cyclase (GGDEF)-like protein